MHEYLKYLRKSLENQRGRKKEDECERVLGMPNKVNDFAAFYETHIEDILTFIAATQHKWEAEKEFDSTDLAIYRLGLTEFAVFMGKCLEERERKIKEQNDRQMTSENPS